jgi:hypothetical protein
MRSVCSSDLLSLLGVGPVWCGQLPLYAGSKVFGTQNEECVGAYTHILPAYFSILTNSMQLRPS